MEPSDLTVRILQEIRDEIRTLNSKVDNQNSKLDGQTARFEVIETTLRDLAQQLVVLGRGVKVLIEQRGPAGDRLDDLERRISALEPRVDDLERRPSS